MAATKTILTVDDSATMRDMLLETLSNLGYRVVQAGDGMHGLETLKDEQPDVIITDINMPRLNGIDFIKRVREDSRHRATPILCLTTENYEGVRDQARRAGATGWIVKPFDPQKLADAIRRVMV